MNAKMSIMGYCTNCCLDLCEVLVCNESATITFPATALNTGVHKVVLEYLNTAKAYEVTLNSGDAVSIELNCLNENYCYEGYIVQPDGSSLMLLGDQYYNCFRFCTKITQSCNPNGIVYDCAFADVNCNEI